MTEITLSLDEVEILAHESLTARGASERQAAPVARSIRLAEADGLRSHGLLYLPVYTEHLSCGKVDGRAVPTVEHPRYGAVTVDAANGFAHPAIDAGMSSLITAARLTGIAAMTLRRSYNCGVLGHHAEAIASAGLIGLCLTHAPASIAPPGGSLAVIGTNPLALAVPNDLSGVAFCLDQSASVVAKSEIMRRAQANERIPFGWAIDSTGRPTTDAAAALAGTMLAAGGHKGFGMGIVAEVFASLLAGAVASRQASSFSGPLGGPPSTGQCFIAIDPAAFAPGFGTRAEVLAVAITSQPGARLPGSRRLAARARTAVEGVRVDTALMERINA